MSQTQNNNPYIDDYYHRGLRVLREHANILFTPQKNQFNLPSLRNSSTLSKTKTRSIERQKKGNTSSTDSSKVVLGSRATPNGPSNGRRFTSLCGDFGDFVETEFSPNPLSSQRFYIEQGYDCLYDIEDIDRILSNHAFSLERGNTKGQLLPPDVKFLERKRQTLIDKLFSSLHIYTITESENKEILKARKAGTQKSKSFAHTKDEILLRILLIPKGARLVSRSILVFGDRYRFAILSVLARNMFIFGSAFKASETHEKTKIRERNKDRKQSDNWFIGLHPPKTTAIRLNDNTNSYASFTPSFGSSSYIGSFSSGFFDVGPASNRSHHQKPAKSHSTFYISKMDDPSLGHSPLLNSIADTICSLSLEDIFSLFYSFHDYHTKKTFVSCLQTLVGITFLQNLLTRGSVLLVESDAKNPSIQDNKIQWAILINSIFTKFQQLEDRSSNTGSTSTTQHYSKPFRLLFPKPSDPKYETGNELKAAHVWEFLAVMASCANRQQRMKLRNDVQDLVNIATQTQVLVTEIPHSLRLFLQITETSR